MWNPSPFFFSNIQMTLCKVDAYKIYNFSPESKINYFNVNSEIQFISFIQNFPIFQPRLSLCRSQSKQLRILLSDRATRTHSKQHRCRQSVSHYVSPVFLSKPLRSGSGGACNGAWGGQVSPAVGRRAQPRFPAFPSRIAFRLV